MGNVCCSGDIEQLIFILPFKGRTEVGMGTCDRPHPVLPPLRGGRDLLIKLSVIEGLVFTLSPGGRGRG